MLPLYSSSLADKDKSPSSLVKVVQNFLRTIVNNRSTRNIFFFLLLNVSFAFVEVFYGFWSNSLGLIGDGVHMFFDSSAIIFGLIASVVTKWPANSRFSYGFGRVETFAGFINTAALAYASLHIFAEALERLVEPPEIDSDQLLVVSFLGLLVNMVGIFAFEHGGHGHSHGGGGGGGGSGNNSSSNDHCSGTDLHHDHSHAHDHGGHDHHGHAHITSNGHNDHSHGHTSANAEEGKRGHSHDHGHSHSSNPLMQGMFLHVLADTLGSVAVIISALCIRYWGWTYADPICSLFLAVIIFSSIMPLLKSSTMVLLQRCPEELDGKLNAALQEVLNIPGVLGFAEPHFWELSQDKFVGTLRVQVSEESNEQKTRVQVAKLFHQLGVKHFTCQIEKLATKL